MVFTGIFNAISLNSHMADTFNLATYDILIQTFMNQNGQHQLIKILAQLMFAPKWKSKMFKLALYLLQSKHFHRKCKYLII